MVCFLLVFVSTYTLSPICCSYTMYKAVFDKIIFLAGIWLKLLLGGCLVARLQVVGVDITQ